MLAYLQASMLLCSQGLRQHLTGPPLVLYIYTEAHIGIHGILYPCIHTLYIMHAHMTHSPVYMHYTMCNVLIHCTYVLMLQHSHVYLHRTYIHVLV